MHRVPYLHEITPFMARNSGDMESQTLGQSFIRFSYRSLRQSVIVVERMGCAKRPAVVRIISKGSKYPMQFQQFQIPSDQSSPESCHAGEELCPRFSAKTHRGFREQILRDG